MTKLLELYHKTGRIGNIVLLVLLIFSGIANRLFMAVKHQYADYVIEVFLIGAAAYLVKRIFDKGTLRIRSQSVYKGLLITGIILRLILAAHDMVNRPVQDSDYEKHERLGYRLAFEGEFYDFTGVELRNFRQPGLPAAFAVGLLIYNDPVTYAVVMILFSFGVLISGFYLFRNFKGIASLITFAYISISPNLLFMASSSNTQLSFFFFVMLLLIMLKNYSGKIYQLVIIGAIIAAEMYVRFNFVMPALLIPFLLEYHSGRKAGFIAGRIAVVLGAALLFYSPWIIRNYNIYGKLRLMPTTGLGLYSSNVTKDYTKMGGFNGVPDSLLIKYKGMTEVELDEEFKNRTKQFLLDNPDLYAKGIPFRLMKYSGRQDWSISYFFEFTKYPNARILESFFQTVENFLFWLILFFPLMFFLKNKELPPLTVFVLWSYLGYSLLLLPVTETRSRYNFPYILFPVIAAALAEGSTRRVLNDKDNGKA